MSKEQLPGHAFSQAEAEAKVGQRVRTKVEFSGVPEGSIGLVIRADLMALPRPALGRMQPVYDVAVQWELPCPSAPTDLVRPAGSELYVHVQPGNPLVDWFTKSEYEDYLEELPGEPEGRGS